MGFWTLAFKWVCLKAESTAVLLHNSVLLVSTERGSSWPVNGGSSYQLGGWKTFDAQFILFENPRVVEAQSRMEQAESASEEITKTLNEVHFASTIKLNVGGKIYKTTLDTLRKDPDSMLCAMFSGRFDLKADEDDGAYFIDRDAELFRYVSLHRSLTPISRDDRQILKSTV